MTAMVKVEFGDADAAVFVQPVAKYTLLFTSFLLTSIFFYIDKRGFVGRGWSTGGVYEKRGSGYLGFQQFESFGEIGEFWKLGL